MTVGVMDTTPQAAEQPDDLRSVATEGSPEESVHRLVAGRR